MGAPSARAASLTAARLLPRHVRAARDRDRTAFLIEDLNGAYFGVVARGTQEERRTAAAARVRRLLAGTAWMSNVAQDAWAYVAAHPDGGPEWFGAAAVLLTVSPDDARVGSWVGTLPAEVKRALRSCLGRTGGTERRGTSARRVRT